MRKIVPLIVLGLTTAVVAAGCGSSGTSSTPSAGGSGGAPASGAPAAAGGSSAGGKAVLPVPKNPIANTSTAAGLTVTKVLVENNVDPATGKGTDDHLEVALKNTGAKPLTGVEVYYLISDPKTKATEGYYAKLDAVTIAPGATEVVNFDNTGRPGHVPVNKYSLYYTDKNALTIDVTASASGVKPATFTVKKDAGGAEAGVE